MVLYASSFTGPTVVYQHPFAEGGQHTVGFQVVGTSTHTLVDEDAFLLIQYDANVKMV